jgi:hypothetical protein
MEEIRGLQPIRPVAYYALPASVAIGAELCPLWENFALDRVLGSKLVPSLLCRSDLLPKNQLTLRLPQTNLMSHQHQSLLEGRSRTA